MATGLTASVKWLAAQCFLGQPLFVFQVSKGNQMACFAHMQGRHYPPQVFHAQPLGNPERWEAQPRAEPGPSGACRAKHALQKHATCFCLAKGSVQKGILPVDLALPFGFSSPNEFKNL